MNRWYGAALVCLAACSSPALSDEKKEPGSAPVSAAPVVAKEEENIPKPPAEQIVESPTRDEVLKNVYVPFHGTYFRLWGGAMTGSQPKGTSVSPDGSSIYVTNFGQGEKDNVWRYDPQTLKVVARVNFMGNAIESVPSKDGKVVYVSNFDNKEMLELDGQKLNVKRRFKVGDVPKHFALSPDEKTLYVSNWESGTVSLVNLATGKERSTITVEKNPRGTAVTHDGKKLYIANFGANTVSVIDLATEKVIKTLPTGKAPRHIAISKDDSRVFVSCYSDTKVHVISVANDEIEKTIEVGMGPKTIELSKDEKFFYTADYKGSSMSIVSTDTWEVKVIPLPTVKSSGLAVSPDDRRIYITGWDSTNLLVIERVMPGDTLTAPGPKSPGAICRRKTKKECEVFP
jgi:YVTN family beta-propeller protein